MLIAILSLTPSPDIGPEIPYVDKVFHFIAYAVLAGLMMWTTPRVSRRRAVTTITIAVSCIMYGLLMEILQPVLWPEDRMYSMADAMANAAGALAAITGWPLAEKLAGKF